MSYPSASRSSTGGGSRLISVASPAYPSSNTNANTNSNGMYSFVWTFSSEFLFNWLSIFVCIYIFSVYSSRIECQARRY